MVAFSSDATTIFVESKDAAFKRLLAQMTNRIEIRVEQITTEPTRDATAQIIRDIDDVYLNGAFTLADVQALDSIRSTHGVPAERYSELPLRQR
jgi:hypothetical protein